jgi:protein phosphatase 2C family protein 2/3
LHLLLQSSPNPESFGGFEELREASLSPDVVLSSTPASYLPCIRSGAASSIGSRPQMEDVHLTLDDISELLTGPLRVDGPTAFFGVFDGHGGKDAADYAGKHLLENLLEDACFPTDVHKALVRSFLETDSAFHQACLAEKVEHSGTTALTALVFGRWVGVLVLLDKCQG